MIPSTASDMLSKKQLQILSFGCRSLDLACGGIIVGGITEISGEAGCGKTQICLSLSLQVQLNIVRGGLDGSAAYVCGGEGLFPIKRLSQLAKEYETRLGVSANDMLSRIHIEQSYNIDEVLDILTNRIPDMCKEKGVRLLVIDSLAGLLRTEFDSRSARDMAQRTALLFRLAAKLKWLSNIFNLCVVVVNQVTATGVGLAEFQHSSPALGMAWAHCVNSRLVLQKGSTQSIQLGEQENERCSTQSTLEVPPFSSIFKIGDSYLLDADDQPDGACVKWIPKRLCDTVEYFDFASSDQPVDPLQQLDGEDPKVCPKRRMLLLLSPCFASGSCNYRITGSGIVG